MENSITLIVQARMGSTRLPGKMLMPLHDGKSMLYWVLTRLSTSKKIDQLVVATSYLEEDLPIAQTCADMNIPCFRGSDWDVLDRFYQAALQYPSDWIIRVCGDSPLINGEIIDFVIDQKTMRQCDYFSNGNQPPEFAEDGFCAEIFSLQNLQDAHEKAEWMSEREHVTPYIKKNAQLHHAWKQFREDYKYKLSVDSLEDFKNVQWIFSQFTDPVHDGMDKVMTIMTRHPQQDWGKTEYNVGYQKSVQQDKKIK